MAVRPVYFTVFVALLVVLHFTVHLSFGVGAGAPDLMTVAVLIAARRLRSGHAAALGFGLGLLDDGLAVTTFGASAFALTIVAYLGARSRDLFEGESLLYVLVYIFLGKWLRDVIVFLIAPNSVRGDVPSALLVGMPLLALYASAAGVAALIIYRAASGERA